MSGICAVWRQNGSGVAQVLEAVNAGNQLDKGERRTQEASTEAGVGVSARFEGQQIVRTASLLVACDAELLNEDELRQAAGQPAETSTAELFAALYTRFGKDFVTRLRGAFSVVVWDEHDKALLAAVDGVGIKRLVYTQNPKGLVIASRIEGVLRTGETDRRVNPRGIVNVLNFSVSLAPGTIINGIQRLIPGGLLWASRGQVHIKPYWDISYYGGGEARESRLAKELEATVESSVRVHAQNEAPEKLGAFLSGGTDSSTVTGIMAGMNRGPVNTFSIGFQEQPFNELGYAEIAAKRFQTKHHTYLVGPDDCWQALPDMVRAFDEPFGNSSAIPTYFCSRLAASNGVRVLLAGDGGDELFGGNSWYATDEIFQIYQHVPAFLRKGLIEPLLAVLPVKNGIPARARSYIRRSNMPPLERVLSYHFLCANAPETVFEGDFVRELGNYSVLEMPRKYYQQAQARDHLDRMLYMDVKIVLGDSDLPKVTRMAELAGIQVRFPLLDRSVAEMSGRIPARLKVKGFEKRYLFKRAFGQLLPKEIIKKKKHGFGIPVSSWLKSDTRFRELAHDTLLSSRAMQRGYFRRNFIEDLFRKHEVDDSSYYGDTLWTFLVLELWHRQAVDEPVMVAV